MVLLGDSRGARAQRAAEPDVATVLSWIASQEEKQAALVFYTFQAAPLKSFGPGALTALAGLIG